MRETEHSSRACSSNTVSGLPGSQGKTVGPNVRLGIDCRNQEGFGKCLFAREAAGAIVDFRRLGVHFNLPPKHRDVALLACCYVLVLVLIPVLRCVGVRQCACPARPLSISFSGDIVSTDMNESTRHISAE